MEPAFSRNVSAWPPAGTGVLPLEPDDPAIAVPPSALRPFVRTPANENFIAGNRNAPVAPPELKERIGGSKTEGKRKWPAAIVVSCCLHAAAALAFLTVPGSMIDPADLSQIQGVDQAGEMIAGNAAEDQVSAGDITNVTLVPMISAKPVETVKAEPVDPARTVKPTEQAAAAAPVTETLEPAREPTMPATIDSTMETATPGHEILAVQRVEPDNANNVIQQSATTEKVEATQPAHSPEAAEKIEEIPQEIEDLIVAEDIPIPQPAPPRPEKKAVKTAKHKPSAGSGGAGSRDSKRGEADGRDAAQAALASQGASRSGIGNAAVSNYPGKIAAKLRRAARNISRAARRQADSNAQVSFVVRSDGDVSSVRLVRSSGSPDLDKTAVAIIRRAAPFPPIPPEADRATWAFTLPIGPF
ncbi:energy transducer TonB family protein [Manganibacter manganicus]|jgi:protein TonB|uniref:TonB C-terminal domain-containing protein n=1 Tax=Manganibacter manganicus TaxID=1873176 RepID=A0A1V8RWG0_9HYPH|nr:TonB family protein [Pseudaminobacter manganicus]OQM77521.1 hypothetical protein BFN67_01400 [Pseudaminobacter manganicus]